MLGCLMYHAILLSFRYLMQILSKSPLAEESTFPAEVAIWTNQPDYEKAAEGGRATGADFRMRQGDRAVQAISGAGGEGADGLRTRLDERTHVESG